MHIMKLITFLLLLSLSSISTSFARQRPLTEKEKKLEENFLKNFSGQEREQMKLNFRKALDYKNNKDKKEAAGPQPTAFFPAKNVAALSKAARKLDAGSVQAYVKEILTAVNAQLTDAEKQQVNKLASGRSKEEMGQLSIAAWYQEGTPLTALALAVRSCDDNKATILCLNNLAAMLHMAGYPQKAIPILQYLHARNPTDAIIHNNLGQSYALLGDKQQTILFLRPVVQAVPDHPEANNTLAHVAASEGNLQQAADLVSKSLNGAMNGAAADLEYALPKNLRKPMGIRKPDLPDAFNEYEIDFPLLQLDLQDAVKVRKGNELFTAQMHAERARLSEYRTSYDEKGKKQLEADIAKYTAALKANPFVQVLPEAPFASMVNGMSRRLNYQPNTGDEYVQQEKKLDNAVDSMYKKFRSDWTKILTKYGEKGKGLYCGEGRGADCEKIEKLKMECCLEIQELSNEYIHARSEAISNFRLKARRIALDRFCFRSFYNYLAAANENLALANFYEEAGDYLYWIDRAAKFYIEGPRDCNSEIREGNANYNMSREWDWFCPFDIELKTAVGKFKLNCKEIAWSYTLGASFEFKHNFKAQQSTLSIGAGIDLEQKVGNTIFGVTFKQDFFITYDKKKKLTDLGIKFSAGLSGGYGSKNILSEKSKFQYTIAINSGFEPTIKFDEGPLAKLFKSSGDEQINPRVVLYVSPDKK